MLRFVWALTDKKCHIYTHFVYVREQWRLWQTACILSLVWVLTESICLKYAHFVHVRKKWRLCRDCTRAQMRMGIDWYHMLFALYLSHRTRCLYLLHLLKFDLASIWGRRLPSGLRGLKFSLRFYLHPFCACASSKGSGETARMLKHIRAFTVPKILRIYFPTIVFLF